MAKIGNIINYRNLLPCAGKFRSVVRVNISIVERKRVMCVQDENTTRTKNVKAITKRTNFLSVVGLYRYKRSLSSFFLTLAFVRDMFGVGIVLYVLCCTKTLRVIDENVMLLFQKT